VTAPERPDWREAVLVAAELLAHARLAALADGLTGNEFNTHCRDAVTRAQKGLILTLHGAGPPEHPQQEELPEQWSTCGVVTAPSG
jgi:hypothetical protein